MRVVLWVGQAQRKFRERQKQKLVEGETKVADLTAKVERLKSLLVRHMIHVFSS